MRRVISFILDSCINVLESYMSRLKKVGISIAVAFGFLIIVAAISGPSGPEQKLLQPPSGEVISGYQIWFSLTIHDDATKITIEGGITGPDDLENYYQTVIPLRVFVSDFVGVSLTGNDTLAPGAVFDIKTSDYEREIGRCVEPTERCFRKTVAFTPPSKPGFYEYISNVVTFVDSSARILQKSEFTEINVERHLFFVPPNDMQRFYEELYIKNSIVANMTMHEAGVRVTVVRYGYFPGPFFSIRGLEPIFRIGIMITNSNPFTVGLVSGSDIPIPIKFTDDLGFDYSMAPGQQNWIAANTSWAGFFGFHVSRSAAAANFAVVISLPSIYDLPKDIDENILKRFPATFEFPLDLSTLHQSTFSASALKVEQKKQVDNFAVTLVRVGRVLLPSCLPSFPNPICEALRIELRIINSGNQPFPFTQLYLVDASGKQFDLLGGNVPSMVPQGETAGYVLFPIPEPGGLRVVMIDGLGISLERLVIEFSLEFTGV